MTSTAYTKDRDLPPTERELGGLVQILDVNNKPMTVASGGVFVPVRVTAARHRGQRGRERTPPPEANMHPAAMTDQQSGWVWC